MDNPAPEEMIFANIRQTIRLVILPLVQAIYDENPSDIMLFCYEYFNGLLQKRESVIRGTDHQNLSYAGECITKKDESIQKRNINEDSESFQTNVQGSASDPLLTTDKESEVVNLRGTSSWDTPSNLTEVIESREVLEDVIRGIGDKPCLKETQMGEKDIFRSFERRDVTAQRKRLLNDAKLGDTNAFVKDDSVFEEINSVKNNIADEVKIDSTDNEYMSGITEKDIKTLCAKFEGLNTSETLNTPSRDCLRHNDFEREITQIKDIEIARNQLSPNSSFGFIPHLNKYDSEEVKRKMNSEKSDGDDFITKIEGVKMIATNICETSADKMSCAKTNFNAQFQNVKEISDVIEGENSAEAKNFDSRSVLILDSSNDIIEKEKDDMIVSNSDKHNLNDTQDGSNFCERKTNEQAFSLEAFDRNMPKYSDTEEKMKEGQEFIIKMSSEQDNIPDVEKSETTAFDNKDDKDGDEDANNKADPFDSQKTTDKSLTKRCYKAHPPLGNFNTVQNKGVTLQRGHFSDHRSNIGEAGHVPFDRLCNTNRASNNYTKTPLKNQVISEPSTCAREFNYSRFSSDGNRHRYSKERPSDTFPERQTGREKISNANPQNIPYSWRKLCKQSHSSENVNQFKETQNKSYDATLSNGNCARGDNLSSLNETEITSDMEVNESGKMKFQASDEINDKTNFGIQEPKEEKKYESNTKEDVSIKLINNRSFIIGDGQQEILSKTDTDANSKDKSQSKEYFYNQDNFISDQSVTENKTPQNWQQSTTEGNMETDASNFHHFENLLHEKKEKAISEQNDHSMKSKLELNAACGDFISPLSDYSEQDTDAQSSLLDHDEKNLKSTEQHDDSTGRISMEYFEEVIERVIEKKNNDSYDSCVGLNFSSYSESDSSSEESDHFYETDDFNMDDTMQNK